MENCTYCVLSFGTYYRGINVYPIDTRFPLSLVRFLDFYGVDYDHTKKFEDGRSPKNDKGWLKNGKDGGLSLQDIRKKLGANSQGIISIRRAEEMSHVYSVYSKNDVIVFVDLQVGQILSPNIDHTKIFLSQLNNDPFELLIVTVLSPQ